MITATSGSPILRIDGDVVSITDSLKLADHSPDGFSWGYPGSGPAQLALALLLHFTDDKEFALEYYQHFKFDVIIHEPMERSLRMPNFAVTGWIEEHGGTVKRGRR
jgi:hypothetical protein